MENHALILDLLAWIAEQPRAYDDVMDAWKTSCPRLTVWEDTVDASYVMVSFAGEGRRQVAITAVGEEFLRRNGRLANQS